MKIPDNRSNINVYVLKLANVVFSHQGLEQVETEHVVHSEGYPFIEGKHSPLSMRLSDMREALEEKSSSIYKRHEVNSRCQEKNSIRFGHLHMKPARKSGEIFIYY